MTTGPPERSADRGSPPFDDISEALADVHRRVVLFALLRESQHRVRALARTIDSADPDAARVQMHHWHLPKLASMGLVSYDAETGRLERGPAFDPAEPVLRALLDARPDLPPDFLPADFQPPDAS